VSRTGEPNLLWSWDILWVRLIQSTKKNDTWKKQVSNRLLQEKEESVVQVESKQTEIDLNQFPTKDLAKSSNACWTLSQQRQDKKKWILID